MLEKKLRGEKRCGVTDMVEDRKYGVMKFNFTLYKIREYQRKQRQDRLDWERDHREECFRDQDMYRWDGQ